MVELRQRSANSSLSDSNRDAHSRKYLGRDKIEYSPLQIDNNNDDEDIGDYVEMDDINNRATLRGGKYFNRMDTQASPHFCVKVAFYFSIVAIIFLSIIAHLLSRDSQYIRISSESDQHKPLLAKGVMGAVYIYMFILCGSSLVWYQSKSSQNNVFGGKF